MKVQTFVSATLTLLSAVPGAFSAENRVKGTEDRRQLLRGMHQYSWCYTADSGTCRAVEACSWANGRCQPSRGAMKRVNGGGHGHFHRAPKHHAPKHHGPKRHGPKHHGGGRGGGSNNGPVIPASVCVTTSSEVACLHMNGCTWSRGRCGGMLDYEEFDSEDFDFELSPDEIDSVDYDDEDEEYYEDED